jgi:hypothetical protein
MATKSSAPAAGLLDTAEGRRIGTSDAAKEWRRWGPYLSERQWGTVREDYSPHGTAWDYLPHDHARSRAYRWGEDGIAGFADDQLYWCLSLALWNGRDPILKERLFGLTNSEGNHGEDVKELYFYSDGVPSHAYMRMLYKYPQEAFPYERLLRENRGRGAADPEFELVDTGIFDERRYFDVTVEYAKAVHDDILMNVEIVNRGPDAAPLHVLPQLWSRNTWSWSPPGTRPLLRRLNDATVEATRAKRAVRSWCVEGADELLFCENETNLRRLFGSQDAGTFKDGFNDFVVRGDKNAIAASGQGTKCAAHFKFVFQSGERKVIRTRFRRADAAAPFDDFTPVLKIRRREADEFYAALQKDMPDAENRLIQRQALAGMLWSKQFYYFDVPEWLAGDKSQPPPPEQRRTGRNADWVHLNNADVIAMPDKWEYPWYAAWDLAFHCVAYALIDPDFAKSQLILLTREWYMHPNGQLPAYEWAFGDVNPPVHAWATWRVYQMDRALNGKGDRDFLERVFHKLMLNFNWWVNRKDAQGRNIFQGGFLGLDNVGVFDRSAPLPTGGYISQADGTAWMAMYALNLMRIALELASVNHAYEDLATKFFEHFLYIANAMTMMAGAVGLWDEQDEFHYDVLNLPNGQSTPMRVRSMVGLIPLFAVEVIEPDKMNLLPEFTRRANWFLKYRPDLASLVSRWSEPASGERHLLSLLRGHRTKRLLRRALDETEFLSDFGIRSLSKIHAEHPYVLDHGGREYRVAYDPGESTSGLFGGNSNWRGPIWMPVNYLLVESIYEFHRYYGDDFTVECPHGSGRFLTLSQVAEELSNRLCCLFRRDEAGRRPVHGDHPIYRDSEFRDHVLFYEYFHGDSGRGVGASHQTGWSGLIALLLQPRAHDDVGEFSVAGADSSL